ncbi:MULTISPECIES: TRAP transporter small permease [Salipiger]|uniref:TRAP transporter small permease protein n=1 Tax=Salipiger bermudensis (strain DSM 26914 / JCM 13377 / KCTC 12554 / HTCC2601) TaxID=314265 RepID=Q0FKR2_SALBH|nr:TRAP transporter small permease [Salipiger bermudensis]EAU44750.1 C4-dicarboxylate transport system permease small protein [Salipiger bermudensis HTCC2601]MBN9677779.1 TRAP transporter small permease [Salipiger bermudensis]MBR9893269.1 TRAP transporter small permease [bacterium]MCA1287725.1 TRAP transporter small permease [Salipiger bermudensis]
MFALLERLCLALRFVVSGVVILLFSVMMISVLVQVGGRYVFNYSIAQASEIATFSQIWLVLLGSGVAVAKGQHVAIDMLPAKLPLPAARVALVAIALVIATFLAVLAYGSLPLLRMGEFQSSPALRVPMKYVYICLPFGAGYMALELLLTVIQRWDNPFPPPEPDAEEAI